MHESNIYLKDQFLFHKHLSKFSCLMIGIGGLIGGGIFSVIGVISIYTGPYAYLSYLITGVVALITVYSYQKLNFKWSGPGGEYSVIQGAFKDSKLQILGAFAGLLLIFGYITSMALYAYTFSIYFLHLFNIEYNYLFLSIIIIVIFMIFTLLNLRGVKESGRFQNILVVIKVLILIVFSIAGIIYAIRSPQQMILNVGLDIDSLKRINIVGIIMGSASIIVSYQGFQLIAYVPYEMKDVKGGLKMMRWSVLISMILYCSVGFTVISILGISGLLEGGIRNAEIAVANAALSFMGKYGMVIIVIGVLLSTASALNATILGVSRLIYIMGIDRIFPKKLSLLSKNKVPYNAILFISILSAIFTILTGGALAIASVAGLIFAQVFFIINFTNFKVKRETKSKAIVPFLGMILTCFFFIILLGYNLINIRQEIISFISFLVMESFVLFFVFHNNKKNNNKFVS
ncbi:MAG: APC family permease [Candidatus Lokiarchaeota archaeon]|nr:APC family permease [Candidatus Lokiarchaeota archaeon]